MKFTVTKEFDDLRLDKFLCKKFDLSFGSAQKAIREKKVKVNERRVDASYKIKHLDEMEIFFNAQNRDILPKQKASTSDKKIAEFLSYIIYRDENLVAINKPSGLAVQGGSGVDICVDDFLSHKILGDEAVLVHRLDKDTSGVLLIALNKKTAEFLTEKFRNKTIKKTYVALVAGNLKKSQGVINIPLLKKFVEKNEKVRPDFEEGKEAITHYKLIENRDGYAVLELYPITGRTHQLRVHCKEIGHPIINDIKYGGVEVSAKFYSDLFKQVDKRLCLHAKKLEIENYFGKKLLIETPLPRVFS